ncbi:outer membrane protein assembly factor BamA [Gemmobacter sp. JM10B15]|uniref:Outer membrane protein assembly factor BamA n=2 Tax=Gemmobacter denitrificans TaxID=3123040 RepID=A0ABU8BPN2_9RHOB
MLMQAHAQGLNVSQVTVEGNQNIDAASILKLAGIGRGETTAAQLNDAYQALQNSGLFETVEVLPQGSRLVIRVKEYPLVNVISFEGNKRLKDEALAEIIQSKARRVYSPAKAEADAALIAEGYREQGRLAASVEPKIIRRSDNMVDLVFEIAEGKPTEIERLAFVGNRAFSDRRLRQVLETKQAGLLRTFIRRDTLQPDRLELDKQLLKDFYLSRGYVDVQILDASAEVARERDGVFVTFTLQEGQQFTFGKISAASEIEGLDATEFEAALKLRPGSVYSPSGVETNITRLENLALKKGLTFVSIEPRITRNEKTRELDVVFTLVRGQKIFVERIDIEGNTTTLDQVVRRQFRTVEGDPFNPREIRQSAERIRALGYFADARVNAEPGTSPDQVVVNVDVEEQPTGSLSFGASYGVSSGLGFSIGLTETNFLGRGQTVGFNISTGTDNTNSSITFIEPAFLGRDLKLKFNTFYNETDNQDATYDTRLAGIVPAIEFPVSELGRLELRYFLRYSDLKDLRQAVADDPATPDVDETVLPTSPIIGRDEAREGLFYSGIGATYSYDSRISGVNPNGGVLLRFGVDYAGLGGDVDSITATALALAETKVWNEEVTLRAVFEGGALHMLNDDPSRVTDRYFGGGKIRGFEPGGIGPRDLATDDALGGNFFAVARFEADFPLGLPEEYGISGGLFADFGSVWSLDDVAGQSGAVDDGFHLRSSVGVSIFWTTPIGPLRFNFSKALDKQDYDKEQSFDLTISTKF